MLKKIIILSGNHFAKMLSGFILASALTVVLFMQSDAGQWIKDGVNWKYRMDNGRFIMAEEGNEIFFMEEGIFSFDWEGNMRTGWVWMNNGWYYFGSNGNLVYDTWIDGKYYVGPYGRMMTNTATPDGYYVGTDGAWIPEITFGANAVPGNYQCTNYQMEIWMYAFDFPNGDGVSMSRADYEEKPGDNRTICTIRDNGDGSVTAYFQVGQNDLRSDWEYNDIYWKNANGVYCSTNKSSDISRFIVLQDGSIVAFEDYLVADYHYFRQMFFKR